MWVQSFLAYSLIEYTTIMGVVDNGIRVFFFQPDMWVFIFLRSLFEQEGLDNLHYTVFLIFDDKKSG